MLNHKGYTGRIEFDDEAGLFHGEVLCPQQAPLEQGLHVAPPIGDHEYIDLRSHHPIDDAVGPEENLAVFARIEPSR